MVLVPRGGWHTSLTRNDGVVYGMGYDNGVSELAGYFDGGSAAKVPDSDVLDGASINDDFSIGMWINREEISGNWETIAGKWAVGGSDASYRIQILENTNKIKFEVKSNDSIIYGVNSVTVPVADCPAPSVSNTSFA